MINSCTMIIFVSSVCIIPIIVLELEVIEDDEFPSSDSEYFVSRDIISTRVPADTAKALQSEQGEENDVEKINSYHAIESLSIHAMQTVQALLHKPWRSLSNTVIDLHPMLIIVKEMLQLKKEYQLRPLASSPHLLHLQGPISYQPAKKR
jgi:hypothetical protein